MKFRAFINGRVRGVKHTFSGGSGTPEDYETNVPDEIYELSHQPPSIVKRIDAEPPKQTVPLKVRREQGLAQLNAMRARGLEGWHELSRLAKVKGVVGKNADELIEGLMRMIK